MEVLNMPVRNRYIEGLNYQLPHPFRSEAERLRASFDTETSKQDGVIRWKSNGRVPPTDILEFWKHIGKRFNMAKSLAAQNRETKESIRQYKENQRPPSQEQLAEMRNEFGKGTIVVDAISGRRTKL
jgi:hypothetical protein